MKKKTISGILICLLTNITISCLAVFVFGTRLYMDDDNILSWMTYGIITEASSRVYCTNVILGWLYKHLFELFSGVSYFILLTLEE